MPSSSGRTRMPHNNRMSTSATLKTNEIWSKAIGHDPYAESGSLSIEGQSQAKLDEEKTQTLMQIARSQNTHESSNDFVAKMYLGLKEGKKRRSDTLKNEGTSLSADARKRLEEDDSSSEDEFVEREVEVTKSPVRHYKKGYTKKNRTQRDRQSSDYDSDDSENSSDSHSLSDRHNKRKHKKRSRSRRKTKKKHKRRRESDYPSDGSCSDDSQAPRDSRRRQRRKHDRKREKRRSK